VTFTRVILSLSLSERGDSAAPGCGGGPGEDAEGTVLMAGHHPHPA